MDVQRGLRELLEESEAIARYAEWRAVLLDYREPNAREQVAWDLGVAKGIQIVAQEALEELDTVQSPR